MHSPGKKSIFSFFYMQKIMVTEKKIHNPGIISDFVRTFFKIFLVVELTKLGRQNFYLGLHSIYF